MAPPIVIANGTNLWRLRACQLERANAAMSTTSQDQSTSAASNNMTEQNAQQYNNEAKPDDGISPSGPVHNNNFRDSEPVPSGITTIKHFIASFKEEDFVPLPVTSDDIADLLKRTSEESFDDLLSRPDLHTGQQNSPSAKGQSKPSRGRSYSLLSAISEGRYPDAPPCSPAVCPADASAERFPDLTEVPLGPPASPSVPAADSESRDFVASMSALSGPPVALTLASVDTNLSNSPGDSVEDMKKEGVETTHSVR